MNLPTFTSLGITLGLALVTVTAPAAAQGPRLEITPYVGAYVPLADLVDEQQIDLSFGHQTALILGGRATLWLGGPFALEGGLLYALSDGESDDRGDVVEIDAHVWAGSARVLFGFGPPLLPIGFHVGGGLAVVGRGGDAFQGVDGTTDIGGVVGVGARVALPGRWGLRLDIEDYLYSAGFEGEEGEEFDSQLQNDLVISLGLSIRLGR